MSAALASAWAPAPSTVRRMRPHRSGSQLALAPSWNWLRVPPPVTTVPPVVVVTEEPLLPLRVADPVRPTVGNRAARCSDTMARAWR